MNVVIPAAGNGRRFWEAGYKEPKPLLDVLGKPMLQRVVECINIPFANYFFIVQQEHIDKFKIDKQIFSFMRNFGYGTCENHAIIALNGVTQGAAETVLKAKLHINNDDPLIICNSDQYFKYDPASIIYSRADAEILTFYAKEEKWSYAKTDGEKVTEVAEKKVISNHATVGMYYFRRGSDFVRGAKQMISANDRTNGEFYVCPVFNWLIAMGLDVRWQQVEEMHGLGTPEDYCKFLDKFQGKI